MYTCPGNPFSMTFLKLTLAFISVIISARCVFGVIYEECAESVTGTFVASTTSCSHYIYCNGEDSFEDQCPNDEYFHVREQVCDVDIDGTACRDDSGFIATTADIVANSSITTPVTEELAGGYTSSPTTTEPSVLSTDVITSMTTENSPLVEQAVTNAASTSTSASTTSSSSPTNVVHSECPPADDPRHIVLMPHTKSCSDYFVCYRGEPLLMHCAPMLHFNVQTGKCDYPQNVNCRMDYSATRELCHSQTVDVYPHLSNCNYFYFCKNGFLLLQQCPFFFGWDYERRVCVAANQVKCYNRRDRF